MHSGLENMGGLGLGAINVINTFIIQELPTHTGHMRTGTVEDAEDLIWVLNYAKGTDLIQIWDG